MSLGIIGTLVNTGIGSLIDDLKRNLPIDSHFVTPHPLYGVDYRKSSHTCVFPKDPEKELDAWVAQQRAVIFVEFPPVPTLLDVCRRRNVPTLAQVDLDWFNPTHPWVSKVTKLVAPNRTTYKRLTTKYKLGNVAYIPAVVDLSMFPFTPRRTCELFLFNNGWGGYMSRKGGDLIQQVPSQTKGSLLVHSQAQYAITGTAKFTVTTELGNKATRQELYAHGDVYLAPTRWEGYGIHILEAMASGLPVLATNGAPMTDYVRDPEWLIQTDSVSTPPIKGRFSPTVCEPRLDSLVERMNHWYGADIRDASIQARQAAIAFSWERNGSEYMNILQRWGAA